MKTSKVNKINDYFREINTEAIFIALKEKSILDLLSSN